MPSENEGVKGLPMDPGGLIIDEVADPVAMHSAMVAVQKEHEAMQAEVLAACERIKWAIGAGEKAFVEEVRHLLQEKAALPAGGYRLQLGVEGGSVGQVGHNWFARLMFGGGDDAILKPTLSCTTQQEAFKDGIRMLRKLGWLSAAGNVRGAV